MFICPDCGAQTTDLEGHLILEGHSPINPIEFCDPFDMATSVEQFIIFRFIAAYGKLDLSGIRKKTDWEINHH